MNIANEAKPPASKTITAQMQTLVDDLASHGEVSDAEVQDLLGIKRTRSFTLLRQMSDANLIRITGRGKNRKITEIPLVSIQTAEGQCINVLSIADDKC